MKKRTPVLVSLLLALLLAMLPMTLLAEENGYDNGYEESEVSFTIFHTNDVHGRFVHGGAHGTSGAIGVDTVASIVAATENALLIDAGDTFHGQTFVQQSRGANAVELMNMAGYDLMAPGNHDFNYGLDRLLELEDIADFGIIAANVFWRADSSPVFTQYVVMEVNGVSVGFFGIATPDTPLVTHPNNVVDIYFGDMVPAATTAVEALEAHGVDVIVAIAHVGLDGPANTVALANAVPAIDLIIDGHSHDIGSQVVNGVVITQAGEHGRYLGRVDITVYDGEVTIVAEVIDQEYAHENFEPNPAIAARIDEMRAELDDALTQVVAYAPYFLDGDRELVRTQEMPLGNLVAESMAWASGADFGFMNSGGIRDSFQAGDITLGDIITVLAFPNYVVVVEITPAQLWEALENGVNGWPADVGRFPQIYGFAFEFDGSLEPDSRVVSISVDGVELDQNDTETVFTMAINDFMAVGGDGFATFIDLPQVGQAGTLADVFTAFITEGEADMATSVDGRIVQVGQAPEPYEPEEPVEEPVAEEPVVEEPVVEEPVIEEPVVEEPVVVEPTVEEPASVVAGTGTVVNCWYLNVRAGAGVNHRVIGVLRRGDVVNVLDSRGGWYHIETENFSGWVFGRYLEVH